MNLNFIGSIFSFLGSDGKGSPLIQLTAWCYVALDFDRCVLSYTAVTRYLTIAKYNDPFCLLLRGVCILLYKKPFNSLQAIHKGFLYSLVASCGQSFSHDFNSVPNFSINGHPDKEQFVFYLIYG